MIERLKTYFRSLGPWARDTAERAASTAAQTFVASVPISAALAAASSRDYAALQALGWSAGAAALGAALAVLKARVAKRFGDPESASFDPNVVAGNVADELADVVFPPH